MKVSFPSLMIMPQHERPTWGNPVPSSSWGGMHNRHVPMTEDDVGSVASGEDHVLSDGFTCCAGLFRGSRLAGGRRLSCRCRCALFVAECGVPVWIDSGEDVDAFSRPA